MRLPPVLAMVLLLAAIAPHPAAGAESAPIWSQGDPKGDFRAQGFGVVPIELSVQDLPGHDHVDLREVRLLEDEGSLTLEIRVEDLRVAHDAGRASALFFLVEFTISGAPTPYRLFVDVDGVLPEGGLTGFVARDVDAWGVCVRWRPDQCLYQPVLAQLNDEANALDIVFLKDALRGVLPTPWGDPPMGLPAPIDLKEGSQLTDLRIEASGSTYQGLPVAKDVYPNEGASPVFTFRKPTPNQDLRLELAQGARFLSVLPGVNQSIDFVLQNNGSTKQLARLSFDVLGAGADKFELSGPSVVTVPAGEARSFRLWIRAGDGAPYDPVHLRAQATGVGGVSAYDRAPLGPGHALGPSDAKLYPGNGPPREDPALCDAWPMSGCEDLRLLPSKPTAEFERPAMGYAITTPYTSASRSISFTLERPLARPLLLSSTGPVEFVMHFTSDVELQGVGVEVSLVAGPRRTVLAAAMGEFTITPEGTTVTLTKKVSSSLALVPAHTPLTFDLGITQNTGDPSVTRFYLWPSRSEIRLPLLDLPDELAPTARSPFQVGVRGEKDVFVNPGETHLYNLTVLNFDALERRASLALSPLPPSFAARFVPGAAFDLRPGEAVNVGLLLTAQDAALEGERATFWVNTSSDDGAVSPLRLEAIVATQVDLPDEAAYRADPESIERLATTPGGKSPAAAASIVLLLLAGAAFRHRR